MEKGFLTVDTITFALLGNVAPLDRSLASRPGRYYSTTLAEKSPATAAMTADDYLNRKLAYLKGLKSPSQAQQLLILLAEKPNRNAEDEKQLAVLLRAERAADRVRAAQLQAAKLLGQRKDAERKVRNHRLILQGLLLDLAGLNDWDRGELLGALLALKESPNVPPERRQQWKQRGEALLAEKTTDKPQDRQADTPPPPSQPPPVGSAVSATGGSFTVLPDRERLYSGY